MAGHPLTGTRIREKRMDGGMRQADLAASVGISPSYLNLIEHNKRRIGGKLLGDLARALGVEPATLTEGADLALLDQLRTAATDVGMTDDVDRAEELATRYPAWAGVIAALGDRTQRLEGDVQALTDRMSHDPQLATALHDVISAVTSIRSTASILVGDDRIDADWQRRFHQNIHDESRRLATESEALITYLEAPKARTASAVSPAEACEAVFAKHGYVFEALEGPVSVLAGRVDEIVGEADLASDTAKALLRDRLEDYARLAQMMPMADFAAKAQACDYDPAVLAAQYDAGLPQVLRRLACLPVADGHPPMGLAVADAAGVITHHKPVPGFSLPRAGAACPLWPLYRAQTQPERPIRAVVTMPDAAQTQLLCYAATETLGQAGFDMLPIYQTTMLVIPDQPAKGAPEQPVGITCRICPRSACVARREPSALARTGGSA